MKIEQPINKNYSATVVRIHNKFALENCDNIEATNIFGFQVLMGKGGEDFGIFFPAETQLSDAYCYENNLYRHADKNRFPDQKGYIEDNRRVRAIKFRGNTSNGFFMPLESLKWTGIEVGLLKEGDEFDNLNGHEICRKYEIARNPMKQQSVVDRGFVRADKSLCLSILTPKTFLRTLIR